MLHEEASALAWERTVAFLARHLPTGMTSREVLVAPARMGRWVENFVARHGETELGVVAGQLTGRAADGSTFEARLPFAASYDGPADPAAFAASCTPPDRWGVLLVRKGGFAIARLRGGGDRRVQGRAAPRAGTHQGRRAEPAAVLPTPRQPGPCRLRGRRRARRTDPHRTADGAGLRRRPDGGRAGARRTRDSDTSPRSGSIPGSPCPTRAAASSSRRWSTPARSR